MAQSTSEIEQCRKRIAVSKLAFVSLFFGSEKYPICELKAQSDELSYWIEVPKWKPYEVTYPIDSGKIFRAVPRAGVADLLMILTEKKDQPVEDIVPVFELLVRTLEWASSRSPENCPDFKSDTWSLADLTNSIAKLKKTFESQFNPLVVEAERPDLIALHGPYIPLNSHGLIRLRELLTYCSH